jgi:hypothetical protein
MIGMIGARLFEVLYAVTEPVMDEEREVRLKLRSTSGLESRAQMHAAEVARVYGRIENRGCAIGRATVLDGTSVWTASAENEHRNERT